MQFERLKPKVVIPLLVLGGIGALACEGQTNTENQPVTLAEGTPVYNNPDKARNKEDPCSKVTETSVVVPAVVQEAEKESEVILKIDRKDIDNNGTEDEKEHKKPILHFDLEACKKQNGSWWYVVVKKR